MPQVIDQQGNTIWQGPYTPEGMREAETVSAENPGSHIKYQNDAPPGEFSQQAMAEQAQIDTDLAAGAMDNAMNPDPRIMSGQSRGMY